MQRIVMVVEFDGRAFHGWQQQNNAISVQQRLQEALQQIEGRSVCVVAAGRTDAGVHAEAMPVHADISAARWQRSHLAYLHGCNSKLPDTIRIVGLRAVDEDFHARFSCTGRSYVYRIWNRSTASALHRWRHWWMPRPLNLDAMEAAAAFCLGRHDFTSLRASGCQATDAVKTIRELSIHLQGDSLSIAVSADGFLYHMVRNLVGNLVDVGLGRRTPEQFQQLLAARDRSLGAPTAPAHGLYFSDAAYPAFHAVDLIGQV